MGLGKRKKFIIISLYKHEFAVIVFMGSLAIAYTGIFISDNMTCFARLPTVDCTKKGLIDMSQLTPKNGWTQTTGIGYHWNSYTNSNGEVSFAPSPEFRNGYQHAVCDLGNSTCEYHFDTYSASDFPFGSVLHFADFLTLTVGLFGEMAWQTIIWIGIVTSFYLAGREIERAVG